MEYKPAFPARLVEWSPQFYPDGRPPLPRQRLIDPAQRGTIELTVEINKGLNMQWIRLESWYWEALCNPVLRDGKWMYYLPEYPPYEEIIGYKYKAPMGNSIIFPTDGIIVEE